MAHGVGVELFRVIRKDAHYVEKTNHKRFYIKTCVMRSFA